MAYDPRQPRDGKGRWTEGGAALRKLDLTEVGRPARSRPRTASKVRGKLAALTRDTKYIASGQADRDAESPDWNTMRRANGLLNYASPTLYAKAMQESGSPRMPRRDAIARAASMERVGLRSRSDQRIEVVANPRTGGFVARRGYRSSSDAATGETRWDRRTHRSASSAKAPTTKVVGKLVKPKPEYVGRRRAPEPPSPARTLGPGMYQTDKGGVISREEAAIKMFGAAEAARRLAKKPPRKR